MNELCAIKNWPLWIVTIYLIGTENLSGFVKKEYLSEYNMYAVDLKKNIFWTWKYVNGEGLLNIYRSIITKAHSYKLELRASNENVFIFC